ncbi:hypothetical protein [Salisaeta longa]|uniref:hypothetical protein n=1 Tax=Salisaeta longa TaxID=503170 RepID=UPI0004221EDF|nr:hypothetical protein [Salisaeta longa]
MSIEEHTVVIPRKENTTTSNDPVDVSALVEAALDKIDADEPTREAAEAALEYSDGCVVLANYLNSQAKRVERMDYRFKVPLIVMAAEMAREDGGAESIYDPEEGALYFELNTDENMQFSFHVYKDWTVDWEAVADVVEHGYPWSGVENQVWALDWLMDYLEVPTDEYMIDSSDEDDDEHYSRI